MGGDARWGCHGPHLATKLLQLGNELMPVLNGLLDAMGNTLAPTVLRHTGMLNNGCWWVGRGRTPMHRACMCFLLGSACGSGMASGSGMSV